MQVTQKAHPTPNFTNVSPCKVLKLYIGFKSPKAATWPSHEYDAKNATRYLLSRWIS